MPDGGTDLDPDRPASRARTGKRRAKLRVADTGSGMDAETAARAFEPFFTTKPVGEGTGLGLAVVHGIVKALGGRIRLRTAPGQGSVFAITLPCIWREDADPARGRRGDPAGPGRTVFLVEPDDAAAEAVGVILRAAGYRVTRHADPSDALAAFSGSRRGHPAGGGTVAAEAGRRRPGGRDAAGGAPPRVVLLAAAPPTAVEIAAAESVGAAIIAKPVLRRELASALAWQLAKPGCAVPPPQR